MNDPAPYLQRLELPASKLDVIAEVEAHGGPQELIESLQRLSGERFENRAAIEAALESPPPRGGAREGTRAGRPVGG